MLKARDSNLELYRIIVMLIIVMHHYVVNSGLMPLMGDSPLQAKSLFLYIYGMWGKTGINCFVLITGYYMCKSKITLRKFLKLLLEIEFYEITICLLFVLFSSTKISFIKFIWYSLPIRSLTCSSFTDCYIVFFLFIPFLNILIKNMDKKSHIWLLFLCLVIYSILCKMPIIPISLNYNYVSWFIIIYLIGAYLRLYPYHEEDVTFWRKMTFIAIVLAIVSVLTRVSIGYYTQVECTRDMVYYYVEDSNALLAVAVSVCLFMSFKYTKLRHNKLINIVGGGTFGILLIHDNLLVRPWLWTFLNNKYFFTTDYAVFHAIISVVIIYVVCSIIEYVRANLFEQPLIEYFYNIITKRVLSL